MMRFTSHLLLLLAPLVVLVGCNTFRDTGEPDATDTNFPPLPVPDNDTCATARPVAPNARLEIGRVDPTDQPGSCSNNGDIWFSFELETRSVVHVHESCGSAVPNCVGVGLVSECGQAASCVHNCIGGNVVEILDPGTHYVVADKQTAGTVFVTLESIPVGEAAPVGELSPGQQSITVDTSGATNTEGTCGEGPDNFVWWVTCNEDLGGTLTASTCNLTTVDTTLQYRSAAGAMSCQGADACDAQSELTAEIEPGWGLHVLFVDGNTTDDAGEITVDIDRP